MVAQPPQQVYNAVHPIAAQYGVPDPIWETVAYMESGYSPTATGDQGTSFGLFQLHEGGQLRSTPSAVMGTSGMPENALEAMPAIGDAWSNLKSSFNPTSLDWWTQFASQSGHPGGGVGNVATQNAAQRMLADYSQSNGLANYNIPIPGGVYQKPTNPTGQGDCPWYCAIFNQLPTCLNCSMSGQPTSDVQTILGNTVSPDWWARVGVYILGGALIIFGAIKLLK